MRATTKCHACLWTCVFFLNPPDDAPCSECHQGEYYEIDEEAYSHETLEGFLASKNIDPNDMEELDQ